MPLMLDRLRTQHQQAQDRYRALESLIADQDREPTDVERGELDGLTTTLRDLQPRITEAVDLERSLQTSGTALATIPVGSELVASRRQPAPEQPGSVFRSWAEYSIALANLDERATSQRDQINEALSDLTVRRAFVDMTTTDAAGLMPPAWLRDIVDLIGDARPFVEAFSRVPLPPSGMTLTFPKVTAKPLVGKQATQKTDIPSQKSAIGTGTSPVTTYGGGEDVSIQLIQRSDPSYWDLMLQLYAEQMAIAVDVDAYATAKAAITGTAITLSAAAPAGWNQLLASGIGTMFAASKMLPNVLVVGTDLWAAFAGAADSTGRPLFPNVNGFNPVGQLSFTASDGTVRGLGFAVDPNIPVKEGVIGNARAFTSFLGPVQNMSSDNPAKLGRDVAIFQMGAFAARRPDAMAKVLLGA